MQRSAGSNDKVEQEYRIRLRRQLALIATAIVVIVTLAAAGKFPGVFGEVSARTVAGLQMLVIAVFIGFTAVNWRCPACRTYLGSDLYRPICRKCRTRLR